jgi:hypothetical protein
MHLLFTAATLIIATGFCWSMQRLQAELRTFSELRRQLLADPERAATRHCAAGDESAVCTRTILIRAEGDWHNVCRHLRPDVFRTERYYRIRTDCALPLPHRQLPSLESTIKR